MTVLIADDHLVFREGLTLLLSRMPEVETVLGAANGLIALDIVKHHKVDLVLMDIEMPVMNGIDATRAIKDLPGCTTSVIALTMYNRYQEVMMLYDAGVDGYLLKDSSITEISKAMQLVSGGTAYYCEAVKTGLFRALMARDQRHPKPERALLTERELEVLLLICAQCSTDEIGSRLFISPLTVNKHRRSILQKTKSKNVAGLVLYAIRNNLINHNSA